MTIVYTAKLLDTLMQVTCMGVFFLKCERGALS